MLFPCCLNSIGFTKLTVYAILALQKLCMQAPQNIYGRIPPKLTPTYALN